MKEARSDGHQIVLTKKVSFTSFPRTEPPPTFVAHVLFRVGDAVASRDVHAAMLDSLRLMKDV
jgi:hypothetical protein